MSIICTCGHASGPMCNGANGCPFNATDGMPKTKLKTWVERLAEEQAKQKELLAKDNTQLPAEVIKREQQLENDPGVSIAYVEGFKEGRTLCATEYALKLQEANAEIDRLKRWQKEAQELLNPIFSYGQSKESGIMVGERITHVVLERAKKFESVCVLLEKAMKHVNRKAHKELINEIKTFLDGTKE